MLLCCGLYFVAGFCELQCFVYCVKNRKMEILIFSAQAFSPITLSAMLDKM